MATLVGTPTNMIFLREYQSNFPNNHEMNFAVWFIYAFPLAILFLLICYITLYYLFISKLPKQTIEKSYFIEQKKKLGKMSHEEQIVSLVFLITALLWFFRSDINIFSVHIFGWSNLFENKEYIQDSTIAIGAALILFLIPSKKGGNLLNKSSIDKLPFSIILLFGGGFALAKGFEISGLSKLVALQLTFVQDLNLVFIIFVMCILITIISEFASNVACIQLMFPILVTLIHDLNIHPLILLIPATLAASLGFMLPVATAPNTIVFSTDRILVKDMLKTGLILDIAGIILITLLSSFLNFADKIN